MKTVLAFGDSLTWGKDPATQGRLAPKDRWPNVLQAGLEGVEVISEGLRGRTTAFDQTTASCDMNGARVLPALLHSHAPLDLVIVMLGLNDVYWGYSRSDITAGLVRIVEIIRHHPYRLPDARVPEILLVAQPPMVPHSPDPKIAGPLLANSRQLPLSVQYAAQETGVRHVDMSKVAQGSVLDGVHLDAANTRAVGEALITPVKELLEL